MRLSKAALATGGGVEGNDVVFNRVVTDSRSINEGDLFVALTGERFDGHDFVEEVSAKGALAAMVSKRLPVKLPQLTVHDTSIALGQLAASWRRRFDVPLIAVTGSNGKTTVKQMIGAILSERGECLVAQGNLNNHIGLPLSLLSLRESHRFAVFELGMNHAGEIGYLTGLTRPDVAVITNAAAAHLEGLGSIENVAYAKGEIFQGLNETGIAVINADDPFASLWRSIAGTVRSTTFGIDNQADVQAQVKLQPDRTSLGIDCIEGKTSVDLPLPGLHNARNALAAVAAALALDTSLADVKNGLEKLSPVKGRLYPYHLKEITLLDDTYNANPDSFRAGLEVLASATGERIVVMGDMAELGENAANLHRQVGEDAYDLGIEKLLALGPLSQDAVTAFGDNARHFAKVDELVQYLIDTISTGVTVLIKGSRSMHMEHVVEALLNSPLNTKQVER